MSRSNFADSVIAAIDMAEQPGAPLARTLPSEDACISCRQGRGHCACAQWRADFVSRLEPLPQPWTAADLVRAVASVLLILLALHLWSAA